MPFVPLAEPAQIPREPRGVKLASAIREREYRLHSLGLRWRRTGGLKGGCQVKLTRRKRLPAQQVTSQAAVVAESCKGELQGG